MLEKKCKLAKELMYHNKSTFLWAFLIGMLTHFIKFVNYYPTWDSMYAMDLNMELTPALGRWLLSIATIFLSTTYDLQWVNGIVAILFCSLTIVLILEIFELRSRFYRALSIILFMVFPTLASTFCYMNWSAAYMFSFFLAILAVYIDIKDGSYGGVLCASLAVCCSLGIYQIYVTTAAVCFLYFLVIQLLKENVYKIEIQTKCVRFAASILLGGVLYWGINTLASRITGIVLSEYQGISTVGQMSVRDYLHAFVRLVESAGGFYLGKLEVNFYAIINIVFIIIAGFMWGYYVLLNKQYEVKRRIIIFTGLCLSLIVTYAFLFVSIGTTYHMIMQIGNYFVYFGVIILLEKNSNVRRAAREIGIGILCVLCFYHFLNDNAAYKQMEMSYQRTCYDEMELLMKIDQVNEVGSRKLALIGNFKRSEEYVDTVPNITGASVNNFLSTPFHFQQFSKYYFNRTFDTISAEQMEIIKRSKEYHEMSSWPSAGCVQMFEDIIVVKLECEE